MRLAQQACSVCSPDAARIGAEQAQALLTQLPDWQLLSEPAQTAGKPATASVDKLVKAYLFKNFAEALTFANRVGELAEAEDHHPALLVEWGKVTVTWWTHSIDGLHQNDFILAARCDEILRTAPDPA
jgi:4a-hydroxytetrahydrobiopterin dehydratase